MAISRTPIVQFDRLRDAPERAGEGYLYVYLAVAPDCAKVGISLNLKGRLTCLQSRAKTRFSTVFCVLLPTTVARRLESTVKRVFGRPGSERATQNAEWLDRRYCAFVMAMMAVPEFAQTIADPLPNAQPRWRELGFPEVRALQGGCYHVIRDGRHIKVDETGLHHWGPPFGRLDIAELCEAA